MCRCVQRSRHACRAGRRRRTASAHMMVQALLPGCSTMQEATNHREARRSKEPPPESDPSRQYVAPAPASSHVSINAPAGSGATLHGKFTALHCLSSMEGYLGELLRPLLKYPLR